MTVDPSPTKYWAILWWIYQPSTEFRWLMDLERRPMQANEFLDFNYAQPSTPDSWRNGSRPRIDLGYPISHVIVEDNAAQRFLLQYDHVRRWMALRSVEIIPHSTHRNKSDAEYGVETIARALQVRTGPASLQAKQPRVQHELQTHHRGHPLPARADRRHS